MTPWLQGKIITGTGPADRQVPVLKVKPLTKIILTMRIFFVNDIHQAVNVYIVLAGLSDKKI
jgi:hypothetical protein